MYVQETGSGSGAGSSVTLCRKESVKRRAECTTSGTYAKRRAVHESPDGTPTASKKGKRKSGLFRRKGKKSKLLVYLRAYMNTMTEIHTYVRTVLEAVMLLQSLTA